MVHGHADLIVACRPACKRSRNPLNIHTHVAAAVAANLCRFTSSSSIARDTMYARVFDVLVEQETARLDLGLRGLAFHDIDSQNRRI